MFFGFDLNLILFVLVLVTGFIWLMHLLFAGKERRRAAKTNPPWWLDYSRSFFPILAAVFVFRAFLFEPYQIPSGSMLPSLQSGDFILVNKFSYGLRLPVNNLRLSHFCAGGNCIQLRLPVNNFRLSQGGPPKAGDVIVFNFPPNPNIRYIKRLVGMPGDRILYKNKILTINDKQISRQADPEQAEIFYEHFDAENRQPHQIRLDPLLLGRDGEWTVPAKHYFVMGDNRDNSNDSRYWGFVPEDNLVGKAIYVWMHWESWSELPSFNRNKQIR